MADPRDNLIRWKPGQSGNPGGFSKKRRCKAALLKLLETKDGLDVALVKAGMKAALEGDFNFWKYLIEMIDGPAKEAAADDELDDQIPRDDHGNPIDP